MALFRIKICGVTNIEDARAAADAGADAVGLNFYAPSPRAIDAARAKAIAESVRGRVMLCGVFVNEAASTIRSITESVGLDLVQLSGNDSAAFLRDLKPLLQGLPVMQAARIGALGTGELVDHFTNCGAMGCLPQLMLLDAYDAEQFGGTGRTVDWEAAAACAANKLFPPLVLAGGLRAENVVDAIARVRPTGVDTASGVESRPGIKDHTMVEQFVRAARAAFDNLPDGS